MSTLLDIRNTYQVILQNIIENEGEITLELETALQENHVDMLEKIDAYCFMIERLEVEHEIAKKKADALNAIAKRIDASREHLRDWLKFNMQAMNKSEFVANDNVVKLSKAKHTVLIQEDKLPKEFFREKVTCTPDKELVRTVIERGDDVPGAHLQEIFSLRITPNALTIKGAKHEPIEKISRPELRGEDHED